MVPLKFLSFAKDTLLDYDTLKRLMDCSIDLGRDCSQVDKYSEELVLELEVPQ